LDDQEAVAQGDSRRLRRALTARIELTEAPDPAHAPTERTYRQVRRDLLAVEARELARLYETSALDEPTRRRLQRELDLEEARLAGD
jgi:CPA1 family monovalent cation:H+ antiporter